MGVEDLRNVVDAWAKEYADLGSQPNIRSVQIFENRGAMMGCSNPHPHGQIWANRSVPNELSKEVGSQGEYFRAHSSTLLGDYLAIEQTKADRVVCANDHFNVVVPFWAVWPFETLLIGKRPVAALD